LPGKIEVLNHFAYLHIYSIALITFWKRPNFVKKVGGKHSTFNISNRKDVGVGDGKAEDHPFRNFKVRFRTLNFG